MFDSLKQYARLAMLCLLWLPVAVVAMAVWFGVLALFAYTVTGMGR